jgi:hypothetical protein
MKNQVTITIDPALREAVQEIANAERFLSLIVDQADGSSPCREPAALPAEGLG